MKIKTSELTGAALDWVVMLLEHGAADTPRSREIFLAQYARKSGYHPSLFWNHGGPIIEREGIAVIRNDGCWNAILGLGVGSRLVVRVSGATPLIAAMRCYVASKMGDTIDIPEELA
jgi:hypothetical protein